MFEIPSELIIDTASTLRGQGVDVEKIKARRTDLVDIADQACSEGSRLMQPVVFGRELKVSTYRHGKLYLENDGYLEGELISKILSAADKIVLAVVTIGSRVEDRSSELMKTDAPLGLAMDGFGNAAISMLGGVICKQIEDHARSEGLRATVRMNPGMIGWELAEGQRQLFSILNPPKEIVTLSQSFQMHPRKSESFIIGIGNSVEEVENPCVHCASFSFCRYRQHK